MAPDDQLKSAYEVALERLRKRDEAEGVERKPPTEAQKAEIAEVRNLFEARLAQHDVMHQSALASALDPGARALLEDAYRRERERLTSERESRIARIRAGT